MVTRSQIINVDGCHTTNHFGNIVVAVDRYCQCACCIIRQFNGNACLIYKQIIIIQDNVTFWNFNTDRTCSAEIFFITGICYTCIVTSRSQIIQLYTCPAVDKVFNVCHSIYTDCYCASYITCQFNIDNIQISLQDPIRIEL